MEGNSGWSKNTTAYQISEKIIFKTENNIIFSKQNFENFGVLKIMFGNRDTGQ